MDRDTLIEIDDLSVSFPSRQGPIHAVRNVSFSIKRGEILALVGESGSGKSTTGLALMRLLQTGRMSGSIRLARKTGEIADLLKLSDREILGVRGNDIAMIFQEPMSSLDPVFTIGTQMYEAVRVHKRVSRRQAHEASMASLAAVGLPDREKCMSTFQHLLSGGMRQRVMIAMSLSCQPSLLIADEPTTALDVTIQAQIIDHLKRLQQQTGMAILFITHNLGLVAEIADRAMVMYAGQIVESGNVRDLFSQPRMPYTQGLLKSLPRIGRKRERADRIKPIRGSLPSPLDLPSGCTFHPRCEYSINGRCDTAPPALELSGASHQVRCCTVERARPDRVMTEKNAPLLEVVGLRKWFDITRGVFARKIGQVRAVDDVSFSVRSHEVLGLAGESGSGKTTIGRSVLRLIEPTGGKIMFDNVDVTKLDKPELRAFRRRMQIVFQDPLAALNPQMTIGEILSEPLFLQGIGANSADRRDRAVDLLKSVALSADYIDRRPSDMSGGQRQRIVIARALAVEPQFIVADEPVSALDVSIQAQIIALLEELKERLGLSMLFISHDLATMEYLSDRIAVLYLGRIMEIGPSTEVCGNPRHPYTEMLISAVPEPDPDRRRRRIVPVGEIPSAAAPPSGCVFRTRCPHAMAECAAIVPPLQKVGDDHYSACLRNE